MAQCGARGSGEDGIPHNWRPSGTSLCAWDARAFGENEGGRVEEIVPRKIYEKQWYQSETDSESVVRYKGDEANRALLKPRKREMSDKTQKRVIKKGGGFL